MTKIQTFKEKLFALKKESIKLQRDNAVKFDGKERYRFADLAQIQDKLEEPLERLRLLITHQVVDGALLTTLWDLDSEESLTSSIPLTTHKAQDKGSEITYYRRYNLLALLDLKTEDDDGKKAQESKKTFSPNTKARTQAVAKKAPIAQIKEHYTVSKENETLYLSLIK